MAVDIKAVAMGGNTPRCNRGSVVSAASSAWVQRGARVRGRGVQQSSLCCYVVKPMTVSNKATRGCREDVAWEGEGRGEVAWAERFCSEGPVAPASQVSRWLDERRSGIAR